MLRLVVSLHPAAVPRVIIRREQRAFGHRAFCLSREQEFRARIASATRAAPDSRSFRIEARAIRILSNPSECV